MGRAAHCPGYAVYPHPGPDPLAPVTQWPIPPPPHTTTHTRSNACVPFTTHCAGGATPLATCGGKRRHTRWGYGAWVGGGVSAPRVHGRGGGMPRRSAPSAPSVVLTSLGDPTWSISPWCSSSRSCLLLRWRRWTSCDQSPFRCCVARTANLLLGPGRHSGHVVRQFTASGWCHQPCRCGSRQHYMDGGHARGGSRRQGLWAQRQSCSTLPGMDFLCMWLMRPSSGRNSARHIVLWH